jgi:hypothetical protein
MRFSIRDVLWLTVVVALAVCWSLDRMQLRQAEVKARRAELSARLQTEIAIAESRRAQNMAARAQAIAELARGAAATQSTDAP